MSTIPGGCFVAPDSLRRLNQKQHARQAKLQQASSGSQTPPLSPPLSPPIEVPPSPSLAKFITNAPLRFSEIFSRSRSSSTPPGTPPLSPSISPRKLPQSPAIDCDTPPPSPFLSPRNPSPLSTNAESDISSTEIKKSKASALSQSL